MNSEAKINLQHFQRNDNTENRIIATAGRFGHIWSIISGDITALGT